ncbi:MAG: phospholipid carrier-dependent glycosyltransferase [Actinomycetales bacterium]|nr:MAG: phospholipid carrier-dependent glycosyltransferase [Actinomycetales bacterium]
MTSPAPALPDAARERTVSRESGAPRQRAGEQALRVKLLGQPPTQPLLGWLGPVLAALFGGVLRFWDLSRPHQLVFDETYYVKQAWSMLQFGVEMRNTDKYGEEIDTAFTHGTLDVFDPTLGDLAVHGPVGKWVIAGGMEIFGPESSFGWRFAVCLLGTVSILMVGRIARRLFSSSVLGTLAALLLAVEGHHYVHSRTSLLDMSVMFFALCAFGALLLDRDRSRGILARKMQHRVEHGPNWLGPWLGWRPWRWVAGISLGLCAGTKWSGLYFLVVFGLMTVFWDMAARRAVGLRRPRLSAQLRDGIPAFFVIVGTTAVTYVLSWWGWFVSSHGYNRGWAADHPAEGMWARVPGAAREWWHLHAEILNFHRGLATPHSYQSDPWSWIVMGRPTSFFAEYPKLGEDGCTVDLCAKVITPIGTPTIWWAAAAAIVVLTFRWLLARDWRAGAILAGYAGGYFPWFLLGERTIYQFYAVSFVPWVVLSVTYLAGLAFGRPTASPRRRALGAAAVGGYVTITVVIFAWFLPVYTAQVVPHHTWWLHMWFPSWV